MIENISKEISLIYEKRRFDSVRAQEKRQQAVYERIPELADIDYEIKLLGVNMGRTAITGNKSDIESLMRKMESLRHQKKKILQAHSVREEELLPQYHCNKCKDTGFITEGTSSVKCSCYRKLVVENLYKNFSLDSNKSMTFDKFNINYYPDRVDRERYGAEISPRERMKHNYAACRHFVDNFDDSDLKNILIYGYAGVGKTFMCGCIANALIEKGIPVLYISSVDMFNIITAARMGKTDNMAGKPEISDLINVELLIIDDLGTESLTESRCSEFLEILNKKKELNGRRPCHILISTNLTPKEIFAKYSERIGSRITSEFICCKFIGEDIRMIDI